MQISTLDIDRYKIYDKTLLIDKIIKKITQCPQLFKLKVKRSATQNGFHITLTCNVETCLKCRMSYDDQNRLSYDLRLRQPHERNILFNNYTLIKAKIPIKF